MLGAVACGESATSAATYSYIATGVFSQSAADNENRVYGLDLDNAPGGNSAGATCQEVQPDYTGVDGTMNVDNAFGGSLQSLLEDAVLEGQSVNELIAEFIAAKDLTLLFTVRGVDSLTSDSAVTLELYNASLTDTQKAGITMTSSNTYAPGNTFPIGAPLVTITNATITAGRLEASTAALLVTLPLGDTPVALTINGARIRANISATGLTNIVIAGSLLVEQLVQAVPQAAPFASALAGFADINPIPGNVTSCSGISIGLGGTAVTANTTPQTMFEDASVSDAAVDAPRTDSGSDAATDARTDSASDAASDSAADSSNG